MRVLKEYEIVDGCCEEGDIVDFRIPLRGACCKYVTPSVKNVFNKFSVRFFVRIVLQTAALYRVTKEKKKKNEDSENEEA